MSDYNPYSLEGKNILITGASSGIGRSTAIECSRMGATLVISGRDKDRLTDTYTHLESSGHLAVTADLNNEADLLNLVEQCMPLDGIVHCAGKVKFVPFTFISNDKIEDMMRTNFISPMILTKSLLKRKKIRKSASIVFISSLTVNCATVGNGIYCSTKGAINAMANVLALEVKHQKIRVNCLLPGMVETNLLNSLTLTPEEFEKDKQQYPLGYGKPEDVAYAAVYLLSNAARWVTGAKIILDGGVSLQ